MRDVSVTSTVRPSADSAVTGSFARGLVATRFTRVLTCASAAGTAASTAAAAIGSAAASAPVNDTGTTTSRERSAIRRWSRRVTTAHRTFRQSRSPIIGVTYTWVRKEPSGPNAEAPLASAYSSPAIHAAPPPAWPGAPPQGLGDRVVGRDVGATFREARKVPLVTRGHDVSAESVLSQRPTLVLAQTDTGPADSLAQIRAAGVPVVVFDEVRSIDEIGARELAVAETLGVRSTGEKLKERTEAAIDAVRASVPDRADSPRVAFLYMRGQAGVYLLGGKGSGADSMIAAAGGVDAGTAMGLDKAFTPITSEALAEAAPDVILMTTTGLESVGGIDGLVKIPGIAQTPAGKQRRVITEEDGLLFSFGARTPVALARLVEALHDVTERR